MLVGKSNQFKYNSYFINYEPEDNILKIRISHGVLQLQLCFTKYHIFDMSNAIGNLKATSIISKNVLSEYNRLLKRENFDYKIEDKFINEFCSDLKIVIDSIVDTFASKHKNEA